MINIFISILLSNIFIFTIAYYISKWVNYNFIDNKENFEELGILGSSLICIIALFLNFFLPLNKLLNTSIILIILLFYLIECFKNKNFLQIKFISLTTLIAFLIICSNNIYRPDAGLYHLPFISILNENKILIGLTNLHFRFGHVSIIQYGSAIFNNHIFGNEGILILPSLIFSYFFIFCSKLILNLSNSRKAKYNSKLFFFANGIFIYFLYKMNNYNNFGNDVPGHIYIFYIILLFIKSETDLDKNIFSKILYFSIFAALIKNTLILIFLIFLFYPFKFLFKQIRFRNIAIFSLILIWFFKNILISGCLIYPIKKTCFDLSWTDIKEVEVVSISSEAWSKAWSDQNKIKLKQDIFIKKFNWIETWSQKHLLRIVKIIFPYILFMFLIIFLFSKQNIYHRKKINFKEHLLVFSSLCSLIWFFKFPMYRYGTSYIVLFLLSLMYLFFSEFVKDYKSIKIKKNLSIIYSLFFIILLSKNTIRIYDNIDNKWLNYPWPQIYSETKENKIIENKKILSENGDIIFYKPNQRMCMYTSSPCTHYNKIISLEKKLGYKIYKKI
jgi:hypothetical protein